MKQNYKNLFEEWEINLARKKVNEFREKWKCLQKDDLEDLMQDCLTHWYFSQNQYKPDKWKKATFMREVLTNKLQDIVRKYERDKRKVWHNSTSIDQSINKESDDEFTLLDTLKDDSDFSHTTELKISLSETYSKLTPQQIKLCEHLQAENPNIKEISQELGIGRATVYREIERIKKIFEDQGLKDFLK